MDFKLKLNERNVDQIDLIKDMKRVAEMIGKNTLTGEEYNIHGQYSSTTIRRRFGSWFVALEEAGLIESRTPANIPEQELIRNLQNVWEHLGRQPVYNEMKKPLSQFHVGTYENRFGSWNKALVAFIVSLDNSEYDTIDQELETDEEIIETTVDTSIKHTTKRHISDRMRFRILMRDGFSCQACGKNPAIERGVELHVDHIIPWSLGGETIESNLVTKCSKCNLGKGNAFTQ
jgi:hypothetical protein